MQTYATSNTIYQLGSACVLLLSLHFTINTTYANEKETLSDQIEMLKEEVINLNRDLFILEEDLLFPSSTQFNIYLSTDAPKYFNLDAVKIKINNVIVSTHIYTENQKSALSKGGIQKLHTGNIKSGEHELVAIFQGQGPESREYKRAIKHDFTKSTDPVHLEIKIEDDEKQQQPRFSVTPWTN